MLCQRRASLTLLVSCRQLELIRSVWKKVWNGTELWSQVARQKVAPRLFKPVGFQTSGLESAPGSWAFLFRGKFGWSVKNIGSLESFVVTAGSPTTWLDFAGSVSFGEAAAPGDYHQPVHCPGQILGLGRFWRGAKYRLALRVWLGFGFRG